MRRENCQGGPEVEQSEVGRSHGRQLLKALRYLLKIVGKLLKSSQGKGGVTEELELLDRALQPP